MTDYIICKENKEANNYYENILIKMLGFRENDINLYDYYSYDKNSTKSKIYIIFFDNFIKCLNIAKEIRQDDWHSQIIIISNIDKSMIDTNLLVISYIDKKDNFMEPLEESINNALKILNFNKTFTFKINNEVCKIPYRDILYIEKDIHTNNSLLHTYNDTYIVNDTIKNIAIKLKCECFMKTHRSCIINWWNVTKYDTTSNILYFGNIKTDLISRDIRQLLKNKLLDNN